MNGSLVTDPMSEIAPKRAYTNIALYKGNIVAVKIIHKKSVDLTRSIRKELKQVNIFTKILSDVVNKLKTTSFLETDSRSQA